MTIWTRASLMLLGMIALVVAGFVWGAEYGVTLINIRATQAKSTFDGLIMTVIGVLCLLATQMDRRS